MNETYKDKGLKRAIGEQGSFRLASNFTFQTMQKVEESLLLHEKKVERRTLLATIIAALFLIASGLGGLIYYFGENIESFFSKAFQFSAPSTDVYIPGFYFLFVILIPIFLAFDHWMRKMYFKRHSGL